jgi:hypothetical protein
MRRHHDPIALRGPPHPKEKPPPATARAVRGGLWLLLLGVGVAALVKFISIWGEIANAVRLAR